MKLKELGLKTCTTSTKHFSLCLLKRFQPLGKTNEQKTLLKPNMFACSDMAQREENYSS